MSTHKHYQAISYFVPDKIPEIRDLFLRKASEIKEYCPAIAIIHAGHNELAYHTNKNPSPELSIPTAQATIDLANTVQIWLPEPKFSFRVPSHAHPNFDLEWIQTKFYNTIR
jgi:hypothetical protein